LGLSVVLGIVKNHCGVVSVDSQPGAGTTFEVFLPCVDMESEGTDAVSSPSLALGDEHILFVDDEEVLVQLGEETLKRLGYRVTATNSSLEALRIFKEDPDGFQLVITDMIMPGMSGSELTKNLLQIKPDLPVVLCTGFSDAVSDARAKQVGFRGYLLKPIDMREMARAVRNALTEDMT